MVAPTTWSQSTILGSSSSRPKTSCRRASQSPVSIFSSSEREAVVTSVTNSPVSLLAIQVSVVVTTPSRVRFSRSQTIFGAVK